MIELETLKELFAGVRAKTKWNIDGPMLWEYFFTDGEEDKLKNAATHLAGQEYRFVDTHETDDSSMRVRMWNGLRRIHRRACSRAMRSYIELPRCLDWIRITGWISALLRIIRGLFGPVAGIAFARCANAHISESRYGATDSVAG